MKINQSFISVIVPCYNEEEVINHTHKRLTAVLSKIKMKCEIIYVSDGSDDKTNSLLEKIHLNDNNGIVKIVFLSRNFGHQIAITAGIDYAKGDAVILIDADLQDPPELIPTMIEKWKEGYRVVYGQRKNRQGESRFKLFTAKYFYKTLTYLSDIHIPEDTGDFRLMDRKVVDVIKSMPEKDRFLRGMVAWLGFNQFALKYDRVERYAGESKYPFWKMVKFSIDAILSFSIKPLRIAMLLGFTSSIVSLGGILYAITKWMIGTPVVGWTLMFIAIMFFSGVQLISLGVIGEYIGRSYSETKNRPLYVIDKKEGFI
ncbi:glycosyltransferase family 2 protein [Methylophilaceae bacterium]|nr:glycosyltransferase family 2 protein [Methylophilaceae bacterium]